MYGLAQMGLMAAEADGKPAALSKVPGASRVRRITAVRAVRTCGVAAELAEQGHLRQQVEGAAAVGDGTAYGRKCAVRRDQALLNGGVAVGADQRFGGERFPGARVRTDGPEHVQQHGLDDVAVVVIEVEVGPSP